jgi:two-component system chemotaxis response regulator CheB
MLTEILQSDQRIEVVGAAEDPYEARQMIKLFNPDVLTLDIEMPKMSGLVFLGNLMRLRPMPVVMISTLTQAGAPATLEALELGAVDFLPKPSVAGATLKDYNATIISKVFSAAKSNISSAHDFWTKDEPISPSEGKLKANFICAIGASTGGTEAIKEVIRVLPKHSPPIVIAQHIPPVFSTAFAERLDACSAVKVFEAQDNQPIRAGCVYIAPGDKHLTVVRSQYGYSCKLLDTELVNHHKPSVEPLFDSVTGVFGGNAMSIMLTGMGNDGAEAMRRMKLAGCYTIVQDEQSSVVWGMPGSVVKLDGAHKILPLNKIAAQIIKHSYE